MEFIKESPEHHFLVFAEKVRENKDAWLAARVHYSAAIQHNQILKQPMSIKGILEQTNAKSDDLLAKIKPKLEGYQNLAAYQFMDGDLVLMLNVANEDERSLFKQLYQNIQDLAGKQGCQFFDLAKGDYAFQKLVDEKFVATERIKAYLALADVNKISSIPLRRDRREEPVVLMVEDDAFTAEYALNILKDDYKTVIVGSGEEALVAYIEHAPDIVFLDIHLPGLNGRETLATIMRFDPRAHIMMLSVDAVKDNIIGSYKSGAAGFLKKPFSSDRLLHAVRKSPYVSTAVVPPSNPLPDETYH